MAKKKENHIKFTLKIKIQFESKTYFLLLKKVKILLVKKSKIPK